MVVGNWLWCSGIPRALGVILKGSKLKFIHTNVTPTGLCRTKQMRHVLALTWRILFPFFYTFCSCCCHMCHIHKHTHTHKLLTRLCSARRKKFCFSFGVAATRWLFLFWQRLSMPCLWHVFGIIFCLCFSCCYWWILRHVTVMRMLCPKLISRPISQSCRTCCLKNMETKATALKVGWTSVKLFGF